MTQWIGNNVKSKMFTVSFVVGAVTALIMSMLNNI